MYRKKWRRTKQAVPLLTVAFAMSFSAIGAAAVNGQPVIAEDAVSAQGPVMTAVRAVSPSAIETEAAQPSSTQKADGSCPTYQEAYEKMAALKSTYPEGTAWTNFTPYGRDGDKGSDYVWKGGKIKGADRGVGCAAFAFILSDEAFGALPARAVDRGGFRFDDVKVGDILRVNNNSHFVIVLQKSAEGVTVAEGNYNKSVHWGRAMSKAEVEGADFIITRYPENYVPADAPGADEVTQSGPAGSLQWTLTNAGTLTISGSGAIQDYTTENPAPWKDYNDSISTIVIEPGVTSIGAYAFHQSKALSVYIPEGVTAIGDSAFRETKLIAVTIPGTVKSIGNDAFRGSSAEPSNLTSVSVAEGLQTIGERAFQGCTALTYIDFPASVSKIGAGAFMSCEKMMRVRFMPGSGEVEMGDNMFSQCWNLRSVTLPKTLTRISTGMFSSCSSLPELYIPKTVTTIGAGAANLTESPFNSCRQLKTIYFGGTQAEWDSMMNPTLTSSLTSIGTQVVCEAEFVDPFAPIPDDPGDFAPAHEHSWATVWASNENYHWHECSAEGCPVTEDSGKDGYAVHNYGGWVIDVNATASQTGSQHRECTVCGYRQSESIPASSGGSFGSGGSSGNTSPGIIPPVTSTTTPAVGTTTPDATGTAAPDTDTAPVATTLPDGTKVEEKTETRENGTKVETKIETKTDGSRIETVVETAADGAVKTIKTETAADGSAVRTENEVAKTSAGTSAELTTTTIIDAGGTITSVTQKAVIEKAAANTSATVVVRKDADGKTTAADASVSKTVSGNKAFLTGAVVAQLKEISGEDNLAVTLTVKDNSGRTKFKVKADADDLHPGNELYIYQYNNNTGEYMMINGTVYKVNKNGSVGVSVSKSATYQLLSAAKAEKINRQILAAVAVKNTSATIKPGKSTKLALNSKLNKANVKSVKYAVPKNAPVKVSKNGKITAKKAGTVIVKAKVTLKNGMKKTVKMKVVVK